MRTKFWLFGLALGVAAVTPFAFGDDSAEVKEKIQAKIAEVRELSAQVEKLRADGHEDEANKLTERIKQLKNEAMEVEREFASRKKEGVREETFQTEIEALKAKANAIRSEAEELTKAGKLDAAEAHHRQFEEIRERIAVIQKKMAESAKPEGKREGDRPRDFEKPREESRPESRSGDRPKDREVGEKDARRIKLVQEAVNLLKEAGMPDLADVVSREAKGRMHGDGSKERRPIEVRTGEGDGPRLEIRLDAVPAEARETPKATEGERKPERSPEGVAKLERQLEEMARNLQKVQARLEELESSKK